MGRTLSLLLCLLIFWSVRAPCQPAMGAMDIAMQLLEAFNQHDAEAMAQLVDPEFELIYVNAEGKSEIAARGPAELQSQMTDYFAARPTVRSDVEGSIDGPRFVAFRERPALHPGSTEQRPSSLAIYEIADNRVRRAWYFPAEPEVTGSP